MPCKWRHYEVADPRSGALFTEPGSWDYVQEQLIGECPIWPVDLVKPLGRIGYQLDLPGAFGHPQIYVKLQLGAGEVFGRSFHYTNPLGG
jgi:hypothetical protein